jgi:hypothetical protein
MEEEDGDVWYCYYAVMKLRWKPSEFVFLPRKEKAMMCAFIREYIKNEEKEHKKLLSRSK